MAGTRRENRQSSQRLILDSGAVIALARGEQRARAFLARALELGVPVEIPVVVVAETIRGGPRDTTVHRVLKAVDSVPAAREAHGRTAGRLLEAARSTGTVDALVVAQAVERRSPYSDRGPRGSRTTCGISSRGVDSAAVREPPREP
jgi:predicted nucleic acid-binding protein